MKIVDIREATVAIASEIRNAYIDFSKMTVSIVALVTDVVIEGKPVIGYGFHSNGRYGQGGLLQERFIPRLVEAAPSGLVDEKRDNLDPFKIWATLMQNEKPGGHGERSVAVGVLDMAVWDAVAKVEEKPLHHLLAEELLIPMQEAARHAVRWYYSRPPISGLEYEMDMRGVRKEFYL